MATKPALAMDLLARMSEDWSETTSAMLSITIAKMMLKLDMTSITLPLDGIAELIADYIVDRSYSEVDGRPYMTITMTKREQIGEH